LFTRFDSHRRREHHRRIVNDVVHKAAAYLTAPPTIPATVYHLLGVPADTHVHDQTSRPHALVIGEKIGGLLG
jgi:hypothetical protein